MLLLAYLAIPIDLIPEFVPVLGYADDAIIVTAVLRSVVRGADSTPSEPTGQAPTDGFAAVVRVTGLRSPQRRGLHMVCRLIEAPQLREPHL